VREKENKRPHLCTFKKGKLSMLPISKLVPKYISGRNKASFLCAPFLKKREKWVFSILSNVV
jgi:hypothetical protein